MWRIWKCRNDLVFNRRTIEVTDDVEQAVTDTREWIENTAVSEQGQPDIQHRRGPRARWMPPEQGWVKCNYDSSHHEGDRGSGIGWIIRNSHGTFMECGMRKFQGRATIKKSECTALIWALQSSWNIGYKKIEFDGDNLTIIRLINGKEDIPRLRHFLREFRHWQTMFTEAKFTFHYREQNKCADTLARQALHVSNDGVLFHSCPRFLATIVNAEADY